MLKTCILFLGILFHFSGEAVKFKTISSTVQKSLQVFHTSHVYFIFSTFGDIERDHYSFFFSQSCTFTVHEINKGFHLEAFKPYMFSKFVTKFIYVLFTDDLRKRIGVPILKPRMNKIYLGYNDPFTALYIARKYDHSIFYYFHIKANILAVTINSIRFICPLCPYLHWEMNNLKNLNQTWRRIFLEYGTHIYLSYFVRAVELHKCNLFVHRFVS